MYKFGQNPSIPSGDRVQTCHFPIFKMATVAATWISDPNDFSYFWSTSHPNASYQVSSQLAFRFRRRSEKYIFKMAAMAAILDFWSKQF